MVDNALKPWLLLKQNCKPAQLLVHLVKNTTGWEYLVFWAGLTFSDPVLPLPHLIFDIFFCVLENSASASGQIYWNSLILKREIEEYRDPMGEGQVAMAKLEFTLIGFPHPRRIERERKK